MLRIRLSRGGKKRQPHYRVVVADSGAKRDGRVVERIGFYDPLTDPAQCRIKEDRALYWLSVGAQPSDAVQQLLERQGTIARFKRYRAGEPIEALVAEFEGRPLEQAAAATAVAEVAEAVTPPAAVAEELELAESEPAEAVTAAAVAAEVAEAEAAETMAAEAETEVAETAEEAEPASERDETAQSVEADTDEAGQEDAGDEE